MLSIHVAPCFFGQLPVLQDIILHFGWPFLRRQHVLDKLFLPAILSFTLLFFQLGSAAGQPAWLVVYNTCGALDTCTGMHVRLGHL